jgi:hypothetical protein
MLARYGAGRLREQLTAPVVPEFVLIRHPFWLLLTVESENVMSVTVLSLFPPTDPMLNPLQISILATHFQGRVWIQLTVLPNKSFQ